MDGNYIKVCRSVLDWEWYKNANTKDVFLHCLLKANWKEGKFQGMDIPRGSFVTSIATLSDELGMSPKCVRTALEHLKNTGELAIKTTNKFTVITVINYGQYQDEGKQRANKGQTKGNQTANKGQTKGNNRRREEGKKERREKGKNKSKDEPVVYYPNDDKLNQAFTDYVDMRKQIKDPMTDRAITMAQNKLKKLAAIPFSDMMDNDLAIEILNEATMHNWKGLYPLKNNDNNKQSRTQNMAQEVDSWIKQSSGNS